MNSPPSTRLQWFLDRIGKRVYRTSNGCSCSSCQHVLKSGIVIEDDFHAEYMYQMEGCAKLEGCNMHYFDQDGELDASGTDPGATDTK